MSAASAWDEILEKLSCAFTAPSRKIFLSAASAWVLVPGQDHYPHLPGGRALMREGARRLPQVFHTWGLVDV